MSGPYQRERDTWTEPMPAAVSHLHDAGRVRSGDPDHLVRDTRLDALTAECQRAGIEVGAYGMTVLEWLAGWESSTAQVVVDLIRRAYDAGREAAGQ